ncbi:imidazolonepropionase-like amidohydrolase [Litorimonas taeanensis]|uniref:Imidazolonepropionase-like amidohydrolase n=1 Tax=Litorimonas taeanensis TaxID=568099 RepID=A0A420WEE5_9PROT|nr:amidohydrolase family protein [Litorimonas taeanensis]RKQ69391.1 imidazolonepropionase-like amidohydrolase [Litorimonas taeanensis]
MRQLKSMLLCFAAAFIPNTVAAQEVVDAKLIKAGHIINVETGRVTARQYIYVEGDRIKDIGPLAELSNKDLPETAEQIDLLNYTLLPGLMDSHVHLIGNANLHGYNSLKESTPSAAIHGVANAKTTLMAGFTTVRNLGAPGFADIDLMNAIDDGTVPGPRIIPAGRSLGITGGHCDNNLLPFEAKVTAGGVADGPWAVRAKVRENNKYGAKVIKFCGTGGVLSKGTKIGAQQFSFEEMKAIVDEADLLGLKVAVHAHGEDGINTAIKAGVDSVEHASFISDEGIRLAKRNGTYLSMDIYVSDYILSEGEAAGILEESLAKERIVGKKQRERFKAAAKAGVKMAFGTDAGVYPHGQNGRQMQYMVDWGLSPIQAIQAATINNATLFGVSEETGSLNAGKFADIIAVGENPLENMKALEKVDFVMKGGVVYKTAP